MKQKTLKINKHTKKHFFRKTKKQKKRKKTKGKNKQTALIRHRSENRKHDVLGWKDL